MREESAIVLAGCPVYCDYEREREGVTPYSRVE